jgi:hypothetical protein
MGHPVIYKNQASLKGGDRSRAGAVRTGTRQSRRLAWQVLQEIRQVLEILGDQRIPLRRREEALSIGRGLFGAGLKSMCSPDPDSRSAVWSAS